MIQPLFETADATAAVGGSATFTFPAVPMGLVWTGTLGIFSAPTAAVFSVRVGVPGAGLLWGSWAGNSTFGPIQAQGRLTVSVTATGLTAGVAYQCIWIGNSCFEWEAIPVSPSALSTAVVASSGGGGSTTPVFVAGGDNATLATSDDAITWTARASNMGAGTFIQGNIAWSPSLALFVIIGLSATSGPAVATSPDGITWTLRTSGFGTDYIMDVAWGVGPALFVIVGNTGKLATSPDGVTWTTRTSSFGSDRVNTIGYSSGLVQYVAGGNTGKLATSPDGVTWTQRVSAAVAFGTNPIRAVAWAPSLTLWCAVGTAIAVDGIATSPDGVTWTTRANSFAGSSVIGAIAWSPALSLFVATAAGPSAIATSPDGINWTARTYPFGASQPYTVAWSASLALFTMVGGGGQIATSPDGINWTLRSNPFAGSDAVRAVGASS